MSSSLLLINEKSKCKMNILFRKGSSKSESPPSKDDSFVLQSTTQKQTTNNNNDDDDLLLVTTNEPNNKPNSHPTLLTRTVEQLFGKTSSKNCNENKIRSDEKMLEQETNADEQLIDLN